MSRSMTDEHNKSVDYVVSESDFKSAGGPDDTTDLDPVSASTRPEEEIVTGRGLAASTEQEHQYTMQCTIDSNHPHRSEEVRIVTRRGFAASNEPEHQYTGEWKITTVYTKPRSEDEPPAKRFYSMHLNIWGGVMALLGTVALAVAFLALNAASLGTVGLAVAGVGVACIAASVGLFSDAAKKQPIAELDLPMGSLLDPTTVGAAAV